MSFILLGSCGWRSFVRRIPYWKFRKFGILSNLKRREMSDMSCHVLLVLQYIWVLLLSNLLFNLLLELLFIKQSIFHLKHSTFSFFFKFFNHDKFLSVFYLLSQHFSIVILSHLLACCWNSSKFIQPFLHRLILFIFCLFFKCKLFDLRVQCLLLHLSSVNSIQSVIIHVLLFKIS